MSESLTPNQQFKAMLHERRRREHVSL